MKTFNVMCNVGEAKYLVSFNDGIKTHKDGSLFFDVKIVSNKKELKAFTDKLLADGYREGI